jgi:integrase
MGYTENDDGSVADFPEASYLAHLHAKAKAAGKPPTWAKNVLKMYVRHIGPKFGRATLADLSGNTGKIRAWHKNLSADAGPVCANHCARIMRAAYRFKAAESEHKLAMADLPTRAVRMNEEEAREVDMQPPHFRKWAIDVAKIKNASRRALHVAMLLSGARPGEISRAKWSDLKLHDRQLVIRKGKASAIVIVLSWPLIRCLRVARDWAEENEVESDFIFPAREGAQRGTRKLSRDSKAQWRGHAKQFAQDGLDFYGNALRHVYTTIAAGHATAADLDLLTSHGPANQTAEYIGRKMRARQREVRDAQSKISRRILALMNDPALRCLNISAVQPVQSRPNSLRAHENSSAAAALAI